MKASIALRGRLAVPGAGSICGSAMTFPGIKNGNGGIAAAVATRALCVDGRQ